MSVNRLRCLDDESRRHALELIGRDIHQNSPSHNSEALRVSGYTENTPWAVQNAAPRHGDPRLGPEAGPLYGKSAVQYGQPVVNARPPDSTVLQPVTWTTATDTSASASVTAQQSSVTPGLSAVVIVVSYC